MRESASSRPTTFDTTNAAFNRVAPSCEARRLSEASTQPVAMSNFFCAELLLRLRSAAVMWSYTFIDSKSRYDALVRSVPSRACTIAGTRRALAKNL